MDSTYKLRECIDAHQNDVKSVFTLSNGFGFISASRDLSVRLWKEEYDNIKLENKFILHKNYISSVIYMNSCLRYTDGIILSSGYDKIIHGYSPLNGELEFSLTGHTDTITSLSVSGMDLVSGSMDKTAIIWNLNTNSLSGTLKGHGQGIWSVVFLQSVKHGVLTASADKEIFLWDAKSLKKIKQFSGHTDCVRNIIEFAERKQFLSCSNDASIRLWSLTNDSCIKKFLGHNAYIYSMSIIPDGDLFVSCGEDGMLCVWDINCTAQPIQTIIHNAQSVWCVAVLNNGDIITGASDGRVRLFSKHHHLQNGVELAPVKSNDALNDQIIKELPSVGIEILSLPGDYDGQLVKVSDDGTLIVYSWSSAKETWIKHKVIDNSTKCTEIKSHDFVFSIDIKDGAPALKLGYNKGEDPWTVAHKFLEDNDLSAMFLDQVANFIITNTNQSGAAVVPDTGLSDPFTGGNRYVPAMPQSVTVATKMFPQTNYLIFDQINASGLSKKIVEIVAGSNGVPGDILGLIANVDTIVDSDCPVLTKWVMDRLWQWDTETLFPLIDILRLMVRESVSNEMLFCDCDVVRRLVSRTVARPEQCCRGNMLTVAKLLVNGFSHRVGENVMMTMFAEIGEIVLVCLSSVSAGVDVSVMTALCSWLLNMAVLINARHDDQRRLELLDLALLALDRVAPRHCAVTVHRLLVTVGCLVCNDSAFTFRETLTMAVYDRIGHVAKRYQDGSKWSPDVVQCSEQLAQLVSSLDLFS